MKGPPSTYWAKLTTVEDATVAWHPLLDHCADVGACAEALLDQSVMRRRLARLGGLEDLSPVLCARLACLAALHDAGKFSTGFQNRAWPGRQPRSGHVKEVLALFGGPSEGQRLGNALGFDDIAKWGDDEAPSRCLIASLSHHGKPIPIGERFAPSIWQPGPFGDPFDGITQLGAAVRNWFPMAYDASDDRLPVQPDFHHALSGLVMLADWLGSDDRFFRFTVEGDHPRFPWAQERARTALTRIGLDTQQPRVSMGVALPDFDALFSFPPRGAQITLQDLPASSAGGIVVLEAETGSGKTEAALARFFELFHAGKVDGMYFALPTRTAATQLHARVVRYVKRAFPDAEQRLPVVMAVPGYLAVDDATGQRLPHFKVLWNDDEHNRWRHRGWAAEHPKRYLAGAIVVGTIDQVLLSGLQVSHAHMRSTALLRHLLVVDEVHASDAYMNRILEHVLARHLAAGGHVLLMSATLGASARTRLLRPEQQTPPPAFDEARIAMFPLVTSQVGSSPAELLDVPQTSYAKVVKVDLLADEEPVAVITTRALDEASRGSRVLILRNTVADCIGTQIELEARAEAQGRTSLLFTCGEKAAPHHSRYAREDRDALDHALEARFGKGVKGHGGCVVVATQTVQQSLDIDVDLLITDLCPMDVLLQRIGRLHRHPDRCRPASVQEPLVMVMVPVQRDLGTLIRGNGEAWGAHGIGSVYEDLLILEATWRCLEQHPVVKIPAMNRDLVESTTHPEELSTLAMILGGSWKTHLDKIRGVALAHQRHASLNLVSWDQPIGDTEAAFPSEDLCRKISTRLGEDDRLLRFDGPQQSPFGHSITLLTIPAFMARGVTDEPSAVVPSRVEDGGLVFMFGNHEYRYDRLGLRLVGTSTEGGVFHDDG